MQINCFDFRFVCHLEPETDSKGAIISFTPQYRYNNTNNLSLNSYGTGPFCKFRISRKFNKSGVYALVIDGYIKYIGECINLSSRYNSGYGNISPRNCFKGGQETNCRLNACIYSKIQLGRHIELWFYETREHKQIEKQLLASSNYEWNRGAVRTSNTEKQI